MILFNLIFFFIIFFGLFRLLCYLYFDNINNTFHNILKKNLSVINIKFFNFFILLNILVGIVGVLTSLVFLNNLNIYYVYTVLCIFSALGFILSKKNIYFKFKFDELFNIFLSNYKNIFFILIFLNLIFALNKSFLPWYDQDEISQYGYFTRLYAEGWTIKNNIWGEFSRFGELIFSSIYFVTNNLVFIKIFKSILFLGNVFCFYCLIKLITSSDKISKVAALILITIPELSYVGFFSMKTDYMLFCYEITSIVLICLSIFLILRKKINDKIILNVILLSIFFSSLAFCIRLSGLYILLINYLIFLIFFFRIKVYKKNFNYIFSLIIKIFLINIFTFVPIVFYNLIEYRNPVYPIGGIWNNFLPNSEFNEFWSLENTKSIYNINIGFPILNEIYILFYNSLGLGRTYFRDLSFIIHPNHFASTGWFSPVTLIILLAPIYFRKSKLLFIISIVFLLLFLFWVNGIQYNRVFLGSSSLAIIILSICLSLDKNIFFYYLSKGLYLLSIITCFILTVYHLETSLRSNPYGLKSLFIDQYSFEDSIIKSLPRLEWNQYITNDILTLSSRQNNRAKSQEILNKSFKHEEIKKINLILKKNNIDIVIHDLNSFENLQTILNKGYIIHESNFDQKYNFNDFYNKKICFLYKKQNKKIQEASLLFSNKNGLKLHCKINK